MKAYVGSARNFLLLENVDGSALPVVEVLLMLAELAYAIGGKKAKTTIVRETAIETVRLLADREALIELAKQLIEFADESVEFAKRLKEAKCDTEST